MLLAVALSSSSPSPSSADWIARARAAETAGADLVTVEPGPADPLLVAALLAAATARIGIVPVLSATITEPFHVSTGLATVDVVSRGRAGWIATTTPAPEARDAVLWDVPDDVDADAAEHVAVVRALWDSWEADAVIRDRATDRFLDRDRLHHVDFRGEHLAVRGPSITPRPPQGHLPVLAGPGFDPRWSGAGASGGGAGPGRAGGHRSDSGSARLPGETDGVVTTEADEAVASALGLLRRDAATVGPWDAVELARAGVDGLVLEGPDAEARVSELRRALAGTRPRSARAASTGDDGVPTPSPGVRHRGDAVQPTGDTLRARLGLAPAVNRLQEVA